MPEPEPNLPVSAAAPSQEMAPGPLTRRNFLRGSALVAAAPAMATLDTALAQTPMPSAPAKQPNIIIYHSDQFRWDFICAAGQNPMDFTPNLDAMYRRGTVFQNFITNQPLCCPSRACLWTGQYATTNGTFKNMAMRQDIPTLATQLTQAGYSANYIGKWHLSPKGPAVPAEFRGGFTGLWQVNNVPEVNTLPYSGEFYDNDNQPLKYEDVYRVDFLTGLAENFLRQPQEKPFLLVLSQIEPHQQNTPSPDSDNAFAFVPPKGYEQMFRNPHVPPDLRLFPGDWSHELPSYYGDCKAIDDSVGRIFKALQDQNLEENTVVIFMSDHGCHFRTRNNEYKRSPHESSIHVPLLIQGPGFGGGRIVPELVSMIDVMPTLLDVAGAAIPPGVQGKSFLPLLNDPAAREAWPNEVLVQISEAELARAIRTEEWTYVALAPEANPVHESSSPHYQDYQLYNNRADPAQIVNLIGRDDVHTPAGQLLHEIGDRSLEKVTADLRARLIALMVAAGEAPPQIDRWKYYP